METKEEKKGAIRDADDPLIGRVLEDRYKIVDVLGAGGVGVVYRAEHLKLGRRVAIKILQPEHAASDSLRKRFEREATALAEAAHPHIVPVTDYGIAGDMPYLVMELLAGQTLEELVRSGGTLPSARAIAIASQVLAALSFAHDRGLIHRDLKPGNVFLQNVPGVDVHVRILDFGLAKFVTGERSSGPALTRTGSVFGTPAYMAPEQAVGAETDARTDVYAVGVMLFEMLAGARPFTGDHGELLRAHLVSPIPSIREKRSDYAATPELAQLLSRALAKEKDSRYRDAGEMLTAVRALPVPPVVRVDATIPVGASQSIGAPARGRPTEPSPARARQSPSKGLGAAAVVVGGAVALVVVALVGALMYALAGDDDESAEVSEDDPTASPEPAKVVLPSPREPTPRVREPERPTPTPTPTVRATGASRGLPPDPWAQPAPADVRRIHEILESGRSISQSSDRSIHAYAQRNDDARGHLLLGRIYYRRGWRSDAIEEYVKAYEMSPEARGAPHMLEDLLGMVTHRAAGRSAERAIQSIYGAEAIPAVDRMLADPSLEDDDRARYERLRNSL